MHRSLAFIVLVSPRGSTTYCVVVIWNHGLYAVKGNLRVLQSTQSNFRYMGPLGLAHIQTKELCIVSRIYLKSGVMQEDLARLELKGIAHDPFLLVCLQSHMEIGCQ